MPKYTKHPERTPVDIALSKVVAFYPWQEGTEMCVKILLDGGHEVYVTENMIEVRQQMPSLCNL